MNNEEKIKQLRLQLEHFLKQLDQMDPEKTSIADVDQLIEMIEKMEKELG
ncbi:SE1561 family protein [Gracilibacillus massiliensis]|nr:SE1561 family protein [Gracilibacillus massiliensis]